MAICAYNGHMGLGAALTQNGFYAILLNVESVLKWWGACRFCHTTGALFCLSAQSGNLWEDHAV